jgi:AcrR family transcriptional regulator
MNEKRVSSPTRDAILAAAAAVVLEQGASRMTLEAVADRAKVSKGGLLYHFSSKDALIQGMIERMNQEFAERIKVEYERDDFGTNQGRWLRALIKATFASAHLELGAGLIAAVLHNPELLDPNRQSYEIRQSIIEQDGIDPVQANIIRYAVDGLWYSELLALAPPKEPLRTQLMERLLSLTVS